MSKSDDSQTEVRSSLLKLREDDLQPSIFMKTRLLAQFRMNQKNEQSVFRWKLVSAFSILGCAILSVALVLQQLPAEPKIVAEHPYVIHVHFSDDEARNVASAEVTLPANVHFVSSENPDLKNQKTMRLPLNITGRVRTPLPFVVASSETGHHTLHVRLYDSNDKLLKQKDLRIRFTKNLGEVALN